MRAPSGAISPDGRVHRLMLSTKIYFKIPYTAVHTLSLFADVTAMSRNLQHMRGGTPFVTGRPLSSNRLCPLSSMHRLRKARHNRSGSPRSSCIREYLFTATSSRLGPCAYCTCNGSRGSGVLCLDPPEVKNYAVASEISWNQWSISGGTHHSAGSGRCEQIFTPNT